MQERLVIYESFTGTQFTTKTKQINISLKSQKDLSLRVARLLTKVFDFDFRSQALTQERHAEDHN